MDGTQHTHTTIGGLRKAGEIEIEEAMRRREEQKAVVASENPGAGGGATAKQPKQKQGFDFDDSDA